MCNRDLRTTWVALYTMKGWSLEQGWLTSYLVTAILGDPGSDKGVWLNQSPGGDGVFF